MKKRQRIGGKGTGKSSQGFWEKEYRGGQHLALSAEPSEDLAKFVRFLEREKRTEYLDKKNSVVDLGCGNGRNLIYLAEHYGVNGTGFDIAHSAIVQAKKASKDLPIQYETRSIAGELPFEDESQGMVLDMMVSHFLNNEQRVKLLEEVTRILKPGGWYFFKTFLLDEDRHAKRLLTDHPSGEEGSYIHPEIRVAEHVFTEEEVVELLSPHFTIHKIQKSHGHLRSSAKRRSISIYAERSY